MRQGLLRVLCAVVEGVVGVRRVFHLVAALVLGLVASVVAIAPSSAQAPNAAVQAVEPGALGSTGSEQLSPLEPTSYDVGAARPIEPDQDAMEKLRGEQARVSEPVVRGFDKVRSSEDKTKRGQFNRTYKNVDGTWTAEISGEPLHYATSDGKWEAIDNALVDDGPDVLRNKANSWSVKFRPLSAGVVFEQSNGTRTTISPVGAENVKPTRGTEPGAAIYRDVLPGIDLDFRTAGLGVKEDIIVKSAAAATVLEFDYDGADFVRHPTEAGAFKDATPGSSLILTPLNVRDATWRLHDPATAVRLERVPAQKADVSRMRVTIDPVWLAGLAESAFPVVIDPSVWVALHSREAYAQTFQWCTGCAFVHTGWDGVKDLRTVTAFDYAQYLGTATTRSKLIDAQFHLGWVDGSTNSGLVALRHAQSYSWCGVEWSGVCNTPANYYPLAGGGFGSTTTGTVVWNVTADMTPYWEAGQVMAWAVSGDQAGIKKWNANLYVTYNRLPIPQQAGTTPANGTLAHTQSPWMHQTPALTDPDAGDTVYYRFVACTNNPAGTYPLYWFAGCNVLGGGDSGWITLNSENEPDIFNGIPPTWLTQRWWGVLVSNTPSPGPTDFILASHWNPHSFTYQNQPPPAPSTGLSPADGFVWSPNLPVTLSAPPVTDPDVAALYPADIYFSPDTVQYRFVIREAGAVGSSYRSGWIEVETSPVTFTIPSDAPLQEGFRYQWQVETRDDDFEAHAYFYGDVAQTQASVSTTFRYDQRLGTSGPSPFQSHGPVTVNLATGNLALGVSSTGFATTGGSVSASFAYNSGKSDTGLLGRYYNDANANGEGDASEFRFERIDPAVNFDWGTGSPAPGLGVDNFVATWSGYLSVPTTGTYWFRAGVDDDMTVTVGTTTALSIGCCTPATSPNLNDYETKYAPAPTNLVRNGVTLTAGTSVPIRIRYREAGGAAYSGVWISE